MRKTVAAWQDGNTLILSCPSSRGGNYLIAARKEGDTLVVSHQCPARQYCNCWHIKEAKRIYLAWRFWESKPKNLRVKKQNIILQPEWVQIPVPGRELEAFFDEGELSA